MVTLSQSEPSVMEISFHLRNLDAAASTSCVTKPGVKLAETPDNEVAFENSRALTAALNNTPQVREDVVRRATELVGDVNYPPPETIRQISHLLGIQMHPESELL